MTIPARHDPAAEALQLAAIRMQEGPYRGHDISYVPGLNVWLLDAYSTPTRQTAPTAAAARRAVDELLSKETRV